MKDKAGKIKVTRGRGGRGKAKGDWCNQNKLCFQPQLLYVQLHFPHIGQANIYSYIGKVSDCSVRLLRSDI